MGGLFCLENLLFVIYINKMTIYHFPNIDRLI